MDCLLLRHGIAVEREEWKGADADRPLTDRGAKRVAQVAAGLKQMGVQPSCLLTSPLMRARETAKILHGALRPRSAIRVVDELLPSAIPDGILRVLQEMSSESCVVLVGHEPHLGLLASLLLSGKPSSSFPFKKAGACLIEFPASVKPSRGTLRWWMGPGQLRMLGKKRAKLEV
jgi:phosphohistidine phosphatase